MHNIENKYHFKPFMNSKPLISALLMGLLLILVSSCAMGIDRNMRPNYSTEYVFDHELDVFAVKSARNESRLGRGTPYDVPLSVIEDVLSTHCGINKDFYFFDRISAATQKGLRERGDCVIYLKYENQDLFITFQRYEDPNHLFATVSDWSKNAFAYDSKKIYLN